MSHHFPKSARLLSRKQFHYVLQKRQVLIGNYLQFHYACFQKGENRLGITISAKYAKANKRNRLKRLIREVFRKNKLIFPHAHIIAKPLIQNEFTLAMIEAEFMQLFSLLHEAKKMI